MSRIAASVPIPACRARTSSAVIIAPRAWDAAIASICCKTQVLSGGAGPDPPAGSDEVHRPAESSAPDESRAMPLCLSLAEPEERPAGTPDLRRAGGGPLRDRFATV